jgi:hypothetical protein
VHRSSSCHGARLSAATHAAKEETTETASDYDPADGPGSGNNDKLQAGKLKPIVQ